jgi:hypothetical protein
VKSRLRVTARALKETRGPLLATQAFTAIDRQAIEDLRRKYALATDLIGTKAPEALAQGLAIYRQIFTPDADIRVVQQGQITRQAIGPQQWFAQVQQALQPYSGVQHLIGTQVVEFVPKPYARRATHACMRSYLQAWHDRPQEQVYLFMGTYLDKVKRQPNGQWRIYDMSLERVSSAYLKHYPPPNRVVIG